MSKLNYDIHDEANALRLQIEGDLARPDLAIRNSRGRSRNPFWTAANSPLILYRRAKRRNS